MPSLTALGRLARTSARYHILPESEPSSEHDNGHPEEPKEDANGGRLEYLDGLRGLACLSVYFWHFSWPYQPQLFFSFGLDRDNHGFFQLPFIRLAYAGDAMVRVFFVLSGFVFSERPLRCLAKGDLDSLVSLVSTMGIRRGFRLFMPPLLTSLVTLIFSLSGLLESPADDALAAGHARTPIRRDTWVGQIADWLQWVRHWLLNPWATSPPFPVSQYGPQFWTIPHEYRCSMTILPMTVVLAPIRQFRRIAILLGLSTYCMLLRRQQEELSLFLFGMALADLEAWRRSHQHHYADSRLQRLAMLSASIINWFLLILGLYLLSWPLNLGYKSSPYRLLGYIDKHHNDWHNIGACLALYAILRIDIAKRLLSYRVVLYLGRISFALYCVHYVLVLLIGRRLVDLAWRWTGKDTKLGYQLGFFIALTFTTPIVVLASHLFYRFVDSTSVSLSKLIKDYITN